MNDAPKLRIVMYLIREKNISIGDQETLPFRWEIHFMSMLTKPIK